MNKLTVHRKSYIRSDGTRIKATTYKTPDKGAPGRGPRFLPKPKPDMLGRGFFELPLARQETILKGKVKKYGNMPVQGELQVLSTFNKVINPYLSKRAAELRKWVANNHK